MFETKESRSHAFEVCVRTESKKPASFPRGAAPEFPFSLSSPQHSCLIILDRCAPSNQILHLTISAQISHREGGHTARTRTGVRLSVTIKKCHTLPSRALVVFDILKLRAHQSCSNSWSPGVSTVVVGALIHGLPGAAFNLQNILEPLNLTNTWTSTLHTCLCSTSSSPPSSARRFSPRSSCSVQYF